MLKRCPIADKSRVRKCTVRLAVKRGFMKVAKAMSRAAKKQPLKDSHTPEATTASQEDWDEIVPMDDWTEEQDDVVTEAAERPVDLPSLAHQLNAVTEQQRGQAVAMAGLGASVQRIERALHLLLQQGLQREREVGHSPGRERGSRPPPLPPAPPPPMTSTACQTDVCIPAAAGGRSSCIPEQGPMGPCFWNYLGAVNPKTASV